MAKRQSDSHQRFAFASRVFAEQSSSEEIPSEIQIIPCGEWNHAFYGPMKIAPADIAEMKKNFDDGVRLDIPITAGHDNGMSGGELPAVGWFTQIIDKGYDGLWGQVEFNDRGKEHLKGREYKYFSAEFFSTYANPTDGKIYKNVLSGGALTNNPFFKEMEPVGTFSEKGYFSYDFNNETKNDMLKIEEVVKLSLSELTQEHKDFLIANKAQLTAEQKATFKEVVGEDAPAPAPTPAAPVAATDKVVTMSEKEANELRTLAEQGGAALKKIEASERKAVVDSLMASQDNKVGRFSEAQRGTVETFIATLTHAQRTTFAELVKSIPVTLSFNEIGDGGGNGADAEVVADKIEKEVKALMASDKSLTYLEAQNRVFTEKPELKKQYDASLKA